MSGPGRTCPQRAERRSSDYAARAGCGDRVRARVSAGIARRQIARTGLVLPGLRRSAERSGDRHGHRCRSILLRRFAKGDAAQVPVLIGTNRVTSSRCSSALQLSAAGRDTNTPTEQYPQLLRETFGTNAAAVGSAIRSDDYGGRYPLVLLRSVTDGVFACAARSRWTSALVEPPYTPTSSTTATLQRRSRCGTLPFPLGASHSLELRYLFDIGGAPPLNSGAAVRCLTR